MTAVDKSERNAPPIRVLVANVSTLLSEIILQGIQQQPDMTLIDYTADLAELATDFGNQIDVIVIGASYVYPPPEICRSLWHSFPALKVLVLTPSGDAAVVYWLSVGRHRLKTVSVETLIGNIRRAYSLDLTTE